MSEHTANAIIEKLVAFVVRFDPRFADEIRGASEEQIAELEEWSRASLPAVYRRFLERMGADPSWLEIGQGDPTIETVLRHYREEKPVTPGYVLIGVANDDLYFHTYLELASDPPRVVAFPDDDDSDQSPLAGSLEDAVCSQVFWKQRLSLLPFQDLRLVSTDPDASPESLQETLSRKGLEVHWFSNDQTCSAESPTAAVHAVRPGTPTLTIRIGAETEAELDALRELFLRTVPGLHGV